MEKQNLTADIVPKELVCERLYFLFLFKQEIGCVGLGESQRISCSIQTAVLPEGRLSLRCLSVLHCGEGSY